MSKFWRFCDFLHRFKKILAIKVKMSFCYGIAWLFHFKMSPNTTICRPSSYGVDLLLVPKSQVLSYRSVKRAQMQAGGLHISQPTSIKSRALLRSAVHAYLFSLHIIWQRLGSYSIREFRKEKINTLDHYPTPYPPLPAVRLAQSDYKRSLLTT